MQAEIIVKLQERAIHARALTHQAADEIDYAGADYWEGIRRGFLEAIDVILTSN